MRIIKYWAGWCGPCNTYAPTFAEAEEKFSNDNVEFVSLNADDPEVQTDMTSRGIKTIPTTVFVKDDGTEVVKRGALSLSQIEREIA